MNIASLTSPSSKTRTIAHAFGTPLVVQGLSWLPLTQVIVWYLMARSTAEERTQRGLEKRPGLEALGVAALKMAVLLGSEWGHNLAHAAAARCVGRPMDEIRILAGMPRCIYRDVNDLSVTPRQHILRALGGPVFNFLALITSLLVRSFTPRGSAGREVADVAVKASLFLSTNSFQPIPGLDGGAILKWGLVQRGRSVTEADRAVQQVNGLLAPALAATSVVAFRRRKKLAGLFAGMLSATCLMIFFGWVKEQ